MPQSAKRRGDVLLAWSVVAGQFPVVGLERPGEVVPLVGGSLPRIFYRVSVVRVHLLDGTYELFRAHFGYPPRVDPGGRQVGAIRGVIETTLSLLTDPDVTHVGVAHDHVIESFRNELFAGYKTGEGIEPELWAQFPLVERAFRAMGTVLWATTTFEADDAMATAAERFKDQVDQVIILSPDKDMAQCVEGERVVTFNRRERKRYAEPDVIEKFGVRPESIPDYLALVGDTADGVPGLPGWGAKSAAGVLARYGHIEDIPAAADDWEVSVRGAGKLAATLRERLPEALLYRTLTTLATDMPMDETLEDLEWRGIDRPAFEELCEELGFESTLTRDLLVRGG